jgi:hypothetical protein
MGISLFTWQRIHPAGFVPTQVTKCRIHGKNISVGVPANEVKRGPDVVTSPRQRAESLGGQLNRARIKALLDF